MDKIEWIDGAAYNFTYDELALVGPELPDGTWFSFLLDGTRKKW